MPVRVTPRTAVVLVSLVFSVAFGLQALGSSPAPKAAAETRPAPVDEQPGALPDLALTAARSVPALRDPRKPRVRRRPIAAAAPTLAPVHVTATPTPVPTPAPTPVAPRYVPPPAPRYVPPPPRKPAPTPAPQPSGQFDGSGSFDSSGAP
jgi:hypothetical protein